MKPLRHLDLFAGIGGFRLGLERAAKDAGRSYRCVGYSEIDTAAARTYQAIHDTTGELELGDIVPFARSRRHVRSLPEFEILTGGFPCQPFSMMGSQRGFDDDRGGLFFCILPLLRARLPPVVILENVRNIRTHANGKTMADIVRVLRQTGYRFVEHDVFNTAEYGLPQVRNRAYILALRSPPSDFVYSAMAIKSHMQSLSWGSIHVYREVLDILERDTGPEFLLSDKIKPTILSNGTGGFRSKSLINRSPARPLCASMVKLHRACQDNYYSLDYIASRGALDDSELDPVLLAKKPIRRLTPREALMLQGFSSDDADKAHAVGVSRHQIYKQAGNAVSVNVPYAITTYLIANGAL
jgi:DNA (cytosine-5)-methyltransferase 1